MNMEKILKTIEEKKIIEACMVFVYASYSLMCGVIIVYLASIFTGLSDDVKNAQAPVDTGTFLVLCIAFSFLVCVLCAMISSNYYQKYKALKGEQ